MEDYSFFQNQFVNRYSDGGASDGSCAMENYSSGDSTYSGEFASNPRPFSARSSPSSNSEGAEYTFGGCYRGETSRRGVGHNRHLRNLSVTSPSPQQVSFKVEPFLHVGPPSPWQQRGWGQTDFSADVSSSPPPYHNFGFTLPQAGPCPSPTNFVADDYRLSMPPALRSKRAGSRPVLTPCNDPHCELRRNGRDMDLDDFDRMQISLRNGPLRQAGSRLDDEAEQEESPSLKYRLAQVRAMIREELAQEQASREARGLYGPRRRDRSGNGKKCKFCLKKNEQPDIVGHHNLKDSRGDVSCPILQQYRCDVCHATGRKAHTIKYCPLNNPDTPHDVILQARLKVYNRNRQREY